MLKSFVVVGSEDKEVLEKPTTAYKAHVFFYSGCIMLSGLYVVLHFITII